LISWIPLRLSGAVQDIVEKVDDAVLAVNKYLRLNGLQFPQRRPQNSRIAPKIGIDKNGSNV
jgi:hypothetical protein